MIQRASGDYILENSEPASHCELLQTELDSIENVAFVLSQRLSECLLSVEQHVLSLLARDPLKHVLVGETWAAVSSALLSEERLL